MKDINLKIQKNNSSGQVVLILLLVMTVALAIGLSIVQRSLTDVSTSTKIEQSSRAFSAAEAGIEKALLNPATDPNSIDVNLSENNSSATVKDSGLLPNPKQALEFPPVSKEEIVHMWLEQYKQSSLEVYWGDINNMNDKPALELNILSLKNGKYVNKKVFLDPDATRDNNSSKPNDPSRLKDGVTVFECPAAGVPPINTSSSLDISKQDRSFMCKAVIGSLDQTLVLLRGRILYANNSHPIAVKPVDCVSASDCSFPKQVKIIQSSGKSGGTQRNIQLFKIEKVVPFYFDYAIFSAGDIRK